MQSRPISKVCPGCGEDGFRPIKPKQWVAFSSDRKCKGCGTIYTPPTPIWTAFIFLLIGVVMLLMGGGIVVASVLRQTMNPPAPPDPLGLLFFGGVAVVGVLAIIHGTRVLLRPGKV